MKICEFIVLRIASLAPSRHHSEAVGALTLSADSLTFGIRVTATGIFSIFVVFSHVQEA